MFDIINYFKSAKDHKEWKRWQESRLLSHYDTSDMFKWYVSNKPDTYNDLSNFSGYSTISIKTANIYQPYYDYCFGNFSIFIASPQGGLDGLQKYAEILLGLYDICKGYSRKLFGDPEFIAVLRIFVATKDVDFLTKFPYHEHEYNHEELHAHTVCMFSLSSLITLLMRDYIGRYDARHGIKMIDVKRCINAYNKGVFGYVDHTVKRAFASTVIDIPKPTNEYRPGKVATWPQVKSIKCIKCSRLTEGSWGKFGTCIDCYMLKVCSACGAPSDGLLGSDNMPKCSFHKKVDDSM